MSMQMSSVWHTTHHISHRHIYVQQHGTINRYSCRMFLLNNGLCIMTNHLLRIHRSPFTLHLRHHPARIRYNTHAYTLQRCTSNINCTCARACVSLSSVCTHEITYTNTQRRERVVMLRLPVPLKHSHSQNTNTRTRRQCSCESAVCVYARIYARESVRA